MNKIRLRLGDCAEAAANIHDNARKHAAALTSSHVKGATIYDVSTDEDRAHAIAILYYLESAPAFWSDEADKTEKSALSRTIKKWREQLGLGNTRIAPPASALRVSPEVTP